MHPDPAHRIRRSTPSRTGPLRGALNAFRSDERSVPPQTSESTAPTGTYAARGVPGTVERAVENAYRILDEQFRLGREAARQYCSISEEVNPVNNYTQQSTDGMFQVWAEMLGWWLDMMGPWVPPAMREAVRAYGIKPPGAATGLPFPFGYPPPFPPGFPFPFPMPQGVSSPYGYPSATGYPSASGSSYPQAGGAPVWSSQASPLGVTLDLVTSRPLEVHVELAQNVEYSYLMVQDLVGVSPMDRIAGVKLESGGDGFPILRLSVSPELRAGVYSGEILDRRVGESRGRVRVLVQS